MNDLVEFTENRVDLGALYDKSNIGETLASLDQDLVGLKPVKTRIREIAALLIVEAARRGMGIQADPPPLHISGVRIPGQRATSAASVSAAADA